MIMIDIVDSTMEKGNELYFSNLLRALLIKL